MGIRGLRIRRGQLRVWAERALIRLSEFQSKRQVCSSVGGRRLLQHGISEFEEVCKRLDCVEPRLRALKPNDASGFRTLRNDLGVAEWRIGTVERLIIPVLSSRTASDPKYDKFIGRFLTELRIGGDPVTSHKQWHVQGLSIDMHFKQPIFVFMPSIRSFEALSLLYHEIGHLFWENILSDAEREHLRQSMRPLDLRLTRYLHRVAELQQASSNSQNVTKANPFEVATERNRSRIRRAKQNAWLQLKSLENLAGDIAADAFAGLVGGHAYTTAFCSFYLCRRTLDVADDAHPPPIWRVWFTRLASEHSKSPAPETQDPLFVTWDAVLQLSAQRQAAPGNLSRETDPATKFLGQFKRTLRSHKVPLAGDATRHEFKDTPRLDWKKARIPEILLVASKYKGTSAWRDYSAWERRVFPRIGLGSSRSVKRLLRQAYARLRGSGQ